MTFTQTSRFRDLARQIDLAHPSFIQDRMISHPWIVKSIPPGGSCGDDMSCLPTGWGIRDGSLRDPSNQLTAKREGPRDDMAGSTL